MEKILLVEDDKELSFITKRLLESKEYEVLSVTTLAQAREILQRVRFDLILLDMLLPDGEGIELCREIRSNSACPIIFVSCLGDHQTKIAALQAGADDYVVKPVNLEELIARVQANIRRSTEYNQKMKKESLICKGFLVRKQVREVWLTDTEGQPLVQIDLSPIEYGLLLHLMEYAGELVPYQKLYQQVWQADDLGDVRTVMVHVSNLRKKLGDAGKHTIQTVRGVGYIFRGE